MPSSSSNQTTPLLPTNSHDSHGVHVEKVTAIASTSAASSNTESVASSIGKRKNRVDEDKDENAGGKEQDSDATLSSNEDPPSNNHKKRRVDESETGHLSEELEVSTMPSTVSAETVRPSAVRGTGNATQHPEHGSQADAAVGQAPPVDSSLPASSSRKKRRFSDDCEESKGGDSRGPSSSSDVPPAPSSSEAVSSSDTSSEQNGSHPAKKARLSDENDAGDSSSSAAPAPAPAPSDDQALQPSTSQPSASRGCLLSLPLELLAEILILTGSPQHVLAVARTCKALCMTLLSPDAQYVWREARKGQGCTFEHRYVQHTPTANWSTPKEVAHKIVYKLPDPPKSFFGEAAYAAFVFDGGKCELCNNETSMSYSSFALRARICKNPQCSRTLAAPAFRRILPGEYDRTPYQMIPVNEGPFLSGRAYTGSMYPDGSDRYVRQEQADAVRASIMSGMIDQQEMEKTKKRNEAWMKFCVEIHDWQKMRVQQLNRMKETNLTLSKHIASSYGWQFEDLNNTVYGPYQLRKTKLIEKIDELDVKLMREEIESQLLAIADKRERRKAEISLMKNRGDVETVYNRLRSTQAYPYMPSLPTFRKLAIIEMLQSAERPTTVASVSDALQNDKVMKELLAAQLRKWVNNAKDELGILLGFPKKWKSASQNILHPVERVTGRFLCKSCGCVEPKYQTDGCMDFAGVCLHVCVAGNKEKGRLRTGKKALWDPANFVKDEKAIKVLRASLAALGHAEDREAGKYMLTVGLAAVCTSCEPCMVLDSRSIIGHCHRHDDMKVSFASQDAQSYCGGFPYRHGLVQKLLGSLSYSAAGKKEIDRKNYGCRHCLRQKQDTEAAAAAETLLTDIAAGTGDPPSIVSPGVQNLVPTQPPSSGKTANTELVELSSLVYQMHALGVEGPFEKPPTLFSFNGMRSHLKAKHHIEDIRDEDIFCFRDPEVAW